MSVLNHPRHRRPSVMKTKEARQTYMEASFVRKGSHFTSETDSFPYDPKLLENWPIPQDLWMRTPVLLRRALEDWQAAGAAVDTGLGRLDDLNNQALDRGWPVKTHSHLSRNSSNTKPTSPSIIPIMHSPPYSFSAGTPIDVTALPPLQTTVSNDSALAYHSRAILDTPPFTPEDAKVAGHAFVPAQESVDLFQLNDRLETFTRRSSETPASTPPQFDEGAWDVLVNSCAAEIDTLRVDLIVNFRHMRRNIEKLLVEIRISKSVQFDPAAKEAFLAWWKEMADKERECERKVRDLTLPDLDKIKEERIANGLHV